MEIRKITKADSTQFKKMYSKYLRIMEEYELNRYYKKRGSKKDEAKQLDMVVSFFKKKNFMILGAFEGPTLVAFINASTHTEEGSSYKFAWINDIFVEKTARKQGLATDMLSRAESWAKKDGAKFIKLSSHVGNTPAKKAWTGVGYTANMIEFFKEL